MQNSPAIVMKVYAFQLHDGRFKKHTVLLLWQHDNIVGHILKSKSINEAHEPALHVHITDRFL